MALQILLGERVASGLRRERVFRDRVNPLDDLDDVDMYDMYRFTRRGVMHLLDELTPHLNHATRRSHAIDGRTQVFTALYFYAQGTVHLTHGYHHGISKASASRCVRRVTSLLLRMKQRIIKFPETEEEVTTTQREFFEVAGFPRVVSAVDCTHVLLKGSNYGEDEYIFVNRKRQKSINVQLMCNTRFHITNVVARWPGSTHDARILQHSHIYADFEEGRRGGVVIGDGGYPLKPWLMTPIPEPTTAAELAYNRAHPKTRVYIEQVNGQIKAKFPCLTKGLKVDPKQACRTIVACCVLFNIAKNLQEPDFQRDVPCDPPGDVFEGQPPINGIAVCNQIVREFF